MTLVQNPRLLSNFCKLLSTAGIIPIKYSVSSRQVTLLTNSTDSNKWKHQISTLLVALAFQQWAINDNKLSQEVAVAGLSLVILIVCQIFIRQEMLKKHEIVHYCSGLLQFHEKHSTYLEIEIKASLLIRINTLVAHAALISAVAIPLVFVHGLHLLNPCKPSLVGYWLIPDCSKAHMPRFIKPLVHCLVIILNHWLWSVNVHGGAFCIGVLMTMGVGAMHQFILRFVSTTNFIAMISHNNKLT